MKNVVIGILLLIIVLIAIGMLQEYGIVNWEWKQLAVAVAALAGPYQFVQNKLEAKRDEKEKKEREFKYKRLEYQQFRKRELSRTGGLNETIQEAEQDDIAAPGETDFEIGTQTFG